MRSILKGRVLFILGFVIFAAASFAQVTSVTSPAGRDDVRACADYAEEVLLDRWDMKQRTDLGFQIFNTVELPLSYLTNISFQDGIFSARSVHTPGDDPDFSDCNVTILGSAYPGSTMCEKNGTTFPIDASKYTRIALRMYLQPDLQGWNGQLLWAKNTMFGGVTATNAFYTYNGWFIYIIDIPALGVAYGNDPWNDPNKIWVDYFRLNPLWKKDKEVKIDWIRLVRHEAALERTIAWTGSGRVDIYLDDDTDPANGNLGALARNISGNSYTFLAGALAGGDYYVAVAPVGTTNLTYAPGFYRVNEVPVLVFDKPSDEGSDDDFVTAHFGDPWDMANSEDVDLNYHLVNPQFTTLDYEDMAGERHFNRNVFLAGAETAVYPTAGDPIVFFLYHNHRGQLAAIDTAKYHNLTFKMGIEGAHSTADGSISRVIWKRNDEDLQNVSQDIIVRQLPDRWVMNKIVMDLKTIPLETDPGGSPSKSGWTGIVDSFRIDPHEFRDGSRFFFDEVRLTADWTADASFPIEFHVCDGDDVPGVALYYDTDKSGYDGVFIGTAFPDASGAGSFLWNTSQVPEGKYWIYGLVDDGINLNRAYARGPIIVRRGLEREIRLSKNRVRLGAVQNGVSTSGSKVVVSEPNGRILNWQASSVNGLVAVSPTSGTGDAEIEILMATTNLSPGSYTDKVRISDPGAVNSPRFIDVFIEVYAPGTTNLPFGVFDTPANGAVVYGAISVTGWALDDIEVARVEIKRSSVTGDSSSIIGPDGLVFISNAVFVEGARPDIETAYPSYPLNYRAGWGYMLLTNMLPNKGNGAFTIQAFAVDREGLRVKLGQKTITGDNAGSVKPFGTIDTPGQGAVISGTSYNNFGWALTPQPNVIPFDGSTIWVFVDGQAMGRPSYNHYREDIAEAFPGYENSDGACGLFSLDTTALANGIHTIAWGVTDSAGNSEGLGSRYFTVQNFGGGAAAGESPGLGLQGVNESGDSSRRTDFCDRVSTLGEIMILPARFDAISARTGYDMRSEAVAAAPDHRGVVRFSISEIDRIELMLGKDMPRMLIPGEETSGIPGVPAFRDTVHSGRLVVGDELRPLPTGSTLDPRSGVFTWQPGPGFLGEYTFVFLREHAGGGRDRSVVKISVEPKF